MGGSSYSDDHYKAAAATRAATAQPTFRHTAAMASAPAAARKVHDRLNPFGVKIRESRDSDVNPVTVPIVIQLDETGSMSDVPRIIQAELCKLFGLLKRQGWAHHPAIMVMATGDARNTRGNGPNGLEAAPLQVGQFESGNEVEEDLMDLYLEGNGGGNGGETYELGMYFVARHTATDAWEKRQEKGFYFIIGDEPFFQNVSKESITRIIGDTVEADIPTKDIVAELQQKWNVYYVVPNMTSGFNDAGMLRLWENLIGKENVIKLQHPQAICELIASTIGLHAGFSDAEIEAAVAGTTNSTVAGSIVSSLSLVKRGEKGTEIKVGSSGAPSGLTTT